MPRSRAPRAALLVVLGLTTGCSLGAADDASERGTSRAASERSGDMVMRPERGPVRPVEPVDEVAAPRFTPSDGRPRDAVLAIPAIGIDGVAVETYRGHTDDAAGHAIQNTGVAASPHGPQGGTGPGGVGNYQVTGHRNSAGALLSDLPALGRGDRVLVEAAGTTYVYRITTTRETSFRSPRSLREQRAAVPGRPGARATRAMITISTCATQEDHAAGNYWADELDNPEHRIDKIGVLVRTRPSG